jgi:BolA family transcriptional regulator, general stress-responsive regulator
MPTGNCRHLTAAPAGRHQQNMGRHNMSVETEMRQRLMVALEPTRLDVINESDQHAGHASSPGTGESHFRLLIVSPLFEGRSRVDRHRMVNEAIGDMLRHRVHALAIKAHAPGEPIR